MGHCCDFLISLQETISSEDAYKFPLFGSAVLFGLYLLFKVRLNPTTWMHKTAHRMMARRAHLTPAYCAYHSLSGQFFNKEYVNLLLSLYFSGIGLILLIGTIEVGIRLLSDCLHASPCIVPSGGHSRWLQESRRLMIPMQFRWPDICTA